MNDLTTEAMLLSGLHRLRILDTSTCSLRRNELEKLYSHASSDTFRTLIGQSIDLTDRSVRLWGNVRANVQHFLAEAHHSYSRRVSAALDAASERVEAANASVTTKSDAKVALWENFDATFAAARESLEAEMGLLKDVTIANDIFCGLSETLFLDIYKPNHEKFHKESVREAVSSLLSKTIDLFSIRDDVALVRRLDPKRRMREHIATGESVAVYLEDYKEQLEYWVDATRLLDDGVEAYVRSVLTNPRTPKLREDLQSSSHSRGGR